MMEKDKAKSSDFMEYEKWGAPYFLDATVLRNALRYVLPAASKETNGGSITHVFWGKHGIVTTDRHRLHISELMLDEWGEGCLLPSYACKELLRRFRDAKKITMRKGRDHLWFSSGPLNLYVVAESTHEYPFVQHVIPAHDTAFALNTTEMRSLIRTLLCFEKRRKTTYPCVYFELDSNKIALVTKNGFKKLISPVNIIKHPSYHGDVGFAVNLKYLYQALAKSHDGPTWFWHGGNLDPILLEAPPYRAILMPTRTS